MKKAREEGKTGIFLKSEPDKLFINGHFVPRQTDQTDLFGHYLYFYIIRQTYLSYSFLVIRECLQRFSQEFHSRKTALLYKLHNCHLFLLCKVFAVCFLSIVLFCFFTCFEIILNVRAFKSLLGPQLLYVQFVVLDVCMPSNILILMSYLKRNM